MGALLLDDNLTGLLEAIGDVFGYLLRLLCFDHLIITLRTPHDAILPGRATIFRLPVPKVFFDFMMASSGIRDLMLGAGMIKTASSSDGIFSVPLQTYNIITVEESKLLSHPIGVPEDKAITLGF